MSASRTNKIGRFSAIFGLILGFMASGCGSSSGDAVQQNLGDTPPVVPTDQGSGSDGGDQTPGFQRPPVFGASEGVLAKNGAFAVKAVWANGPKVDPDNHLSLVFAAKDRGAIQTLAAVTLVPFMPSMGHGAPVKRLKVSPNANGFAYDVVGLNFIMPGAWTLTVTATVDGVTDAAVIEVDVP